MLASRQLRLEACLHPAFCNLANKQDGYDIIRCVECKSCRPSRSFRLILVTGAPNIHVPRNIRRMDEPRPTLPHHETSITVTQRDRRPDASSPVLDLNSEPISAGVPAGEAGLGSRAHDIIAFIIISIMLIWPWVFFGVVWVKKGIQMNNHLAKVVQNHPHSTTYFITLICNIISMIVGAFFSLTIIRFAQELVTNKNPTKPLTLNVLHGFKEKDWTFGWSDSLKHLLSKETWWPLVLLIVCVLTFPQVTSSATSLLTPVQFYRTAKLTGTELDFSAAASECLNFFAASPINNTCGYQSYEGLYYTNCLGENQMVDVLEAGRGNILELVSNNTQSLTFSQLGADDGLHFLGSIRGVLPMGPNGVPAVNRLARSPLSNPQTMAGINSYNYTLNHQGLSSNVSCSYSQTYPFHFEPLDNNDLVLTYNVSCAALGEIEVLTNVPVIRSTNSNNLLAYWACQSAPGGAPAASYTIYLAGLYNYAPEIGNITCTVNPIQAAIFPVTYQSAARIFTTANTTTTGSAVAFPSLINYALVGLGDVISEGQNAQSNPVAESVFTFGTKSFNKLPTQSDLYLQLFERMIQGIIEYEITYIRLLYSTVPNPPSSCIRTVNGTTNYEVFGWFVTSANIGFLVPITIINMGALIALWRAMLLAKAGSYNCSPFDDRPVEYVGEPKERKSVPEEWRGKICFQPATFWKEIFKPGTAVPTATKPAIPKPS